MSSNGVPGCSAFSAELFLDLPPVPDYVFSEEHGHKVRKLKKRVDPDQPPRHWDVKNYVALSREELDGPNFSAQSLPRIDARTCSQDEWFAFEAQHIPCVIDNVMDDWKAVRKWRPDRMLRKYEHKTFDIGSFNYTDMEFGEFLHYARTNGDDSPLYVFDPYFVSKYPKMATQFSVPRFFRDEDFHHYAGEKDRPLYRWFLCGPERSGTGIHQDPGKTSAWNALVHGTKRWCFFPPHISGSKLKMRKGVRDEGIDWFMEVYPKVKDDPSLGMIEYTQKPGETLFVPWDWWHVVLNTSFTVSVTQNFCSRVNLPQVWAYQKTRKPCYARRLYFQLPAEVRQVLDVADFDLTGPVEGSDSTSSSSSTPVSSSTGASSSGSYYYSSDEK
eukprot:Amastigsp_a842570_24.p1 type:complete len:386 gc:universal Amastigsp_a842570_24:1166-9(-)